MAIKKKGLGKGLDILLGDAFTAAEKQQPVVNSHPAASATESLVGDLQTIDAVRSPRDNAIPATTSKEQLLQLPIEQCQRGRYQPRRAIDTESLEELASSIKAQGVMQPIIVRRLQAAQQDQPHYEIIAGERRWRASQLAGLTVVPAILKNVNDEAASAMALIENLQRDDLNPMDEAYALSRLQQEFEFTHQQIADKVGKSRTAVSNALRLISLHKDVRTLLENGDIEMGHARALLALPESQQASAAREVVNRSLSVRQTEALTKNWPPKNKAEKVVEAVDANIRQLETNLADKLGVPVALKHKPSGAGQLTLKYNSLDELDGIIEHLNRK
jgi:ParB family chromosome partitioning protein